MINERQCEYKMKFKSLAVILILCILCSYMINKNFIHEYVNNVIYYNSEEDEENLIEDTETEDISYNNSFISTPIVLNNLIFLPLQDTLENLNCPFDFQYFSVDNQFVFNNVVVTLEQHIHTVNHVFYIWENDLEKLLDIEILINLDTNNVVSQNNSDFMPIFNVYYDIPLNVIDKMLNISLPNKEVAEELSMVEVTHIDFYDNVKIGSIIINKTLAQDISNIFENLYYAEFPIHSILLVDNFNGDDNASMVANNTSAFNYRFISGTEKLSNHSYGTAIDINPFINPHVINNKAYPTESQAYINRNLDEKGMINRNDYILELFSEYGWSWGGSWSNPDYQHFEKNS